MAAVSKRRRHLFGDADHFDVRDFRLSNRWRNDKRVGDAVMAKMLAGIEPERFEALAEGTAAWVQSRSAR